MPKKQQQLQSSQYTEKSSSELPEFLSKNIFACDHWVLRFPIRSSGSRGWTFPVSDSTPLTVGSWHMLWNSHCETQWTKTSEFSSGPAKAAVTLWESQAEERLAGKRGSDTQDKRRASENGSFQFFSSNQQKKYCSSLGKKVYSRCLLLQV